MKRFNFNHFIVFGLCFLILIFMFLPYVVVDYGYGTSTASGFEIIFSSMNGALSFAYFLQYLLPIFAMAGLTGFLKGKTRSITMVNIASFGVLIQIISMCSTLGSAVGAGLILALIFWIFILTFSIFDLLNLDVVAKIKAASARSATLLVVCPSCGTTQSGQTRFCANCGATLPQIVQQPVYQQPVQPAAPAAPVTPQPQQVQQPAPSAYAPAPQAVAETPAQNTCPSCGASCVPGAAFCPRCGGKLR